MMTWIFHGIFVINMVVRERCCSVELPKLWHVKKNFLLTYKSTWNSTVNTDPLTSPKSTSKYDVRTLIPHKHHQFAWYFVKRKRQCPTTRQSHLWIWFSLQNWSLEKTQRICGHPILISWWKIYTKRQKFHIKNSKQLSFQDEHWKH